MYCIGFPMEVMWREVTLGDFVNLIPEECYTMIEVRKDIRELSVPLIPIF
jgi:hypothetical protein